MTPRMTATIPSTLPALAALIALAWLAMPAAAQLPDPTRPPADAYALPAGEGMPAPVAATPIGPQLQSVLISRKSGGRQLAVISGQTVSLGGKVDGAKLIEIRSNSVVLQRGSRKEVLKLATAQAEKP